MAESYLCLISDPIRDFFGSEAGKGCSGSRDPTRLPDYPLSVSMTDSRFRIRKWRIENNRVRSRSVHGGLTQSAFATHLQRARKVVQGQRQRRGEVLSHTAADPDRPRRKLW